MKRFLLGLLAVGCADPSITVVFDLGDDYGASVNNVALKIYQPLPAAPFTCDDLAFDLVDDEVLRLSLVSEVALVTSRQVPLGAIDRLADKIFLAEGFDGEGNRLVKGCAEQGEISEETELLLTVEPIKTIEAVGGEAISVGIGETLTEPVRFSIKDGRNREISGAEVRWSIDGAGGAGASGVQTSDGAGIVGILPMLPSRPGPFVLDVAIRWAARDPDLVQGFVRPEAEVEFLPGPARAYRTGRIGPDGEAGFVALLEDPLPGTFKVAHVYKNAAGDILVRVSQSFDATAPILSLIESRTAGTRDRAFVVGVDRWVEVSVDGSLIPRALDSGGLVPLAAVMTGPCEAGSTPQIGIAFDNPTGANVVLAFFTDDAMIGEVAYSTEGVVSSGCVTDVSGGVVRAILLRLFANNPLGGMLVAVPIGNELVADFWFAVASGVGVGGSNDESLLVGTQLQGNEILVSRYAVQRGTNPNGEDIVTLVYQGDDIPTGFPVVNAGGDLDGDGQLDVVSLVQRQASLMAPVINAVWASLGREIRGQRIAGEFVLPTSIATPDMLLADMDGDGSEDVVVADITSGTGVSQTRFEIYAMGDGAAR